jgi:hypothetical protein
LLYYQTRGFYSVYRCGKIHRKILADGGYPAGKDIEELKEIRISGNQDAGHQGIRELGEQSAPDNLLS